MSGLCNGTFLPGEDDDFRQRWGPLLNDHHLFRDADAAEAFVPLAARRYSEHAPFFAFEVLALTRAPS